MQGAAKKLAVAVGLAMVLTALFLPGRSTQETAVLKGLTSLSTGTIQAAEGQG
jgi:hypothetical protein